MKYIDAEKLIAEIKRQIESAAQKADIYCSVDDVENEKKYDDERNVLERLLELVTSLQQEQPEVNLNEEVEEYLDGFIKMPTREYFRKAIKYFYSLGLNARKEQPEVDLEKEIEEQINMYHNECEKKLNQMSDDDTDISFLTLNNFARHFYELGLNARKEESK